MIASQSSDLDTVRLLRVKKKREKEKGVPSNGRDMDRQLV